jgi:hypothetical protein
MVSDSEASFGISRKMSRVEGIGLRKNKENK